MNAWERGQAQTHLEQLARRRRVHIVWRERSWLDFEVMHATRQVFIAPPRSILAYLGALHEFGHLAPVSKHAHRYWPNRVLAEEAAAWEWAFRNMLPSLRRLVTSRVKREVARAWGSYLPGKVH